MDKNINLVEILKDCPKGTKLYSTIFGDVEFESIQNDSVDFIIEIKLSDNSLNIVTTDGRLYEEFNGECILFPSRDQRDWSKFKPKPKFDPKTLQEYNKVLVRDANDREWTAMLFSHINAKGKVIVAGCTWEQVIPYNDDTRHLVGTTEEAPDFYRYWEE